MVCLFFFLSFVNTILDSLKDTLVITASGGGAQVRTLPYAIEIRREYVGTWARSCFYMCVFIPWIRHHNHSRLFLVCYERTKHIVCVWDEGRFTQQKKGAAREHAYVR
jgi:hypothetical protein